MAVILLVDIDAFFPQAEQLKRPELLGRPVIVGGRVTDRSVVASASYEARARGVRTAMPIAQAARLCPEATFLQGDFRLYAELSEAMYTVCLRHTPLVEMVSLDEAFLDVSGCERHYGRAFSRSVGTRTPSAAWPLVAASDLQRDIFHRTGLRVSIGVAGNRMMAKVASELAKPSGVLHVRPGHEATLLAPLGVRQLPGVGPKTSARLERYNLQTVGQLATMSADVLAESFGAAGDYLYEASHGRGATAVVPQEGLPKSISRETTFGQDTCDRGKMSAMLSYLLQRACRQLRDDDLLAATVSLKLRYADFQTVTRSRTLPNPTDHDDQLYEVLTGLLNRTYTRRVGVRLVGVALSNLATAGRQMLLFSEAAYERRSRLYSSVDAVRHKFGFSSLVTSQAVDLLATHERTRNGFRLPVACLSR